MGTGATPRRIKLSASDFGPERTIQGKVASGASVARTVRPYSGTATGFWGAETSPPSDALWALSIGAGSEPFEITQE